jgi:hypothetical protein
MRKKNTSLTFSHVNDETNLSASPEKKVIRMLSEGFCIGILSPSYGIERLFQYSFDPNLSFNDKLEAICERDQEKNISCEENFFRLYTNCNVQIPEAFHDKSGNEAILALITDKRKYYLPFEEKVEAWKLYNLSAWEKTLYGQLEIKFPNYHFSTVTKSFLEVVAKQAGEKRNVFIFVENNNFAIAAIDDHALKGINNFPFHTEKDFLYYCCSFLRKIFPTMENISLKLCGNITRKSPLYNALKRYFRQVEFLLPTKEYHSGDSLYARYCDLFE